MAEKHKKKKTERISQLSRKRKKKKGPWREKEEGKMAGKGRQKRAKMEETWKKREEKRKEKLAKNEKK